MIKGICRVVAFLLLAAGFVAAVMDGARSLANRALDYAPLGATALRLLGERFVLWQQALEGSLPAAFREALLLVLAVLPTSLTLLAFGLLFHRLGRRTGAGIGHITRN